MSEDLLKLLPSIILGVLGLSATIWFSVSANRRENHKIMKELFKDFNRRYGNLNDKLVDYVNENEGKKKTEDHNKEENVNDIIDYFNLCAEQYFWYKRKRIDNDLWESWNSGMNYWYSFECIKKLWKSETENRKGKLSYYIKNGDEFFKDN